MDPLVSIIVVSHNYGRFLAEAIESALAQTYPNLDLLIIDDGSTDDSLEVASKYTDRVRLITQPNAGVERTCNRGVAAARGEYFSFLSADDIFEPTYVENLLDSLDRTPGASFAYCSARLFGAKSGVEWARPYSAYWLLKRLNYINGSALTARKDYLEVGGYSEELQDYGFEDWDFWLSMLEHGKRGTYVPKPLLLWRRHATGSRNPQRGPETGRSAGRVRERHAALWESVSGPRAATYYAFDTLIGIIDRRMRLSRSERVRAFLEEGSWRRFQRHHAPTTLVRSARASGSSPSG